MLSVRCGSVLLKLHIIQVGIVGLIEKMLGSIFR